MEYFKKQDYSSKVKEGLLGRPEDLIDPNDKDELWADSYLDFMYGQFCSEKANITESEIHKMNELKLYGVGNQDHTKYIPKVKEKKGPGKYVWLRKGLENIDYTSLISVAPKYKRIVLGILENVDYDATVNAIDPHSNKLKEQKKWELWYEKEMGLAFVEQKQAIGIPQQQRKYIPDTLKELEIIQETGGFKLNHERAIEKALSFTWQYSRWSELKRQIMSDAFDYNRICVSNEVDPQEKKVKGIYVDPRKYVCQYSEYNDHRDSEWGFHFREMKIQDVRKRLLDEEKSFEEKQLRDLALDYSNKYGNPNYHAFSSLGMRSDGRTYNYDDCTVLVIDGQWVSLNQQYQTIKNKDDGSKDVFNEKYGEGGKGKGKQKNVVTYKVLYRAKKIIGTDIVFDFGLEDNTPRPNMKKVKLTTSCYKITGKSILETMLPHLDTMQRAYIKYQNAINKMRNAGIAVEFNAISNMNLGSGKMKPLEVLRITKNEGDFIYKLSTHAGIYNNARPIQELQGGAGRVLDELIKVFEREMQMVRDLTGINEIADASNPKTEITATAVERAVQGTTNSLKPLFSNYMSLKEDFSESTILRIKNIVLFDKEAYEGYVSAIGGGSVESFKISEGTAALDYGIVMRVKPTDKEIETVRMVAIESMKVGKSGAVGIKASDYFMIERFLEMGNLKTAQVYLAYKENLMAEKMRIEKQNDIQLQGEQNLKLKQQEDLNKRNEILYESALEKIKSKLTQENTYFEKAIDFYFDKDKKTTMDAIREEMKVGEVNPLMIVNETLGQQKSAA